MRYTNLSAMLIDARKYVAETKNKLIWADKPKELKYCLYCPVNNYEWEISIIDIRKSFFNKEIIGISSIKDLTTIEGRQNILKIINSYADFGSAVKFDHSPLNTDVRFETTKRRDSLLLERESLLVKVNMLTVAIAELDKQLEPVKEAVEEKQTSFDFLSRPIIKSGSVH